MSLPESPFIFVVCQTGVESALKQEFVRRYPHFKPSYARPGYITFKNTGSTKLTLDFELKSVLAHEYGLSIGKAQGVTQDDRLTAVRAFQVEYQADVVSVYPRARDEETLAADDPVPAIKQALQGADQLQDGQLVLDVVIVEQNEWWIGLHKQTKAHRPWPGGIYPGALPPEAPSRAYLKLEEGLEWSRLPVKSGELAIEFGASPGGASYALLERGLHVLGVDPAKMADVVLNHPKFKHLHAQAGQLTADDAPGVEWIFSDMNITPDDVLKILRKLVPQWKETLLGGLVTLKLKSWDALADLEKNLEELRRLGFVEARAGHLHSNRQEVCVALLTGLAAR